MDLTASLRALRRQWILTSLLLLLTLAAGVAAWVKVPGPYSTKSMIALLPSQQASKINGNNPYMSYGGSENVAGDIVLREVMDPSIASALAGRGYTGSYTIADDPNTSGPILDITVTASNKNVAESTLRGVTNEVQTKLDSLQQFLLPANRITSMVVSFDSTATLEVSKKARGIVLIVGLGLVLTYVIPQIVDAEVTRRRGRRGTEYVPPTGPPAGEDQQDAPAYQPAYQQDAPAYQPDAPARPSPHRRRYVPARDPEPTPESAPAARPYVERRRGAERVAPAPEPWPHDGRTSVGAAERSPEQR
jgi:hypothetical protein